MKKLLSFILILTLVISCVSMVTFTVSAEDYTYGQLTYTYYIYEESDDCYHCEVWITDCDTSASGALEIPATIDGYPVTSIFYSAFDGCSGLTSITIPDSVTSIGSSAFSGCSSLKEVHITDLKAWCNIKFSDAISNPLYYAHNLYLNGELVTDLIVPDGVTSIGFAFRGCSSLTSVTIPDGVTSIGNWAFLDCSSLTSITIGNSVTSIGDRAFQNCSSLTSITIPDSLTSIVGYAFNGCSKLSTVYYNGTDEQWNNITIGSNNTPLLNARLENSIAYATYEISNNEVTITDFDTSRSGKIELPATIEGYPITKIGASAFAGCASITEIILPDSITEIGASAFEECNLITEIVIPDSVTEIGAWAFYNCSALTEINIPASVTKINSYTFNNCSALTAVWFDGTEEQWASITISSGNTPLKNAKVYYNFAGHKDITKYLTYTISSGKVTITDCDTSIADAYFIPDTIEGYPVTSIGSSAFSGCSSLTSITIPDSVTSIGERAFEGCSSLKEVHITDLKAWCNIKFSYYLSNPLYYAHNLYLNGELVTDLIIPDSVTSIGERAFEGCSSLTSVTIPDSVTSIGARAFQYCSSLTSVTIPDSVTSISAMAFEGCSSLTSVTIPDSVTSIGSYAFKICSSLTSIIIPDSITSISIDVFYGCSSLTSITIPDSVTSIGDSAFYKCSSLETVYYPATKAKWNNITIGGNNEALTNAELICIDPQITGSSVDVGSTLTVNYFVEFNYLDKFNLTADDFTMRFTSPNGRVELVKGTYDPQSGYYKYPYAGVNPQCMNDNIKAELIYNEEVCAIKEYYSVKEYCERQVSRTAEQLGLTETQYNALKTLLADMLVYGSEAQKYREYNDSELPDVDEWISEYKSTFKTPDGVKKVTGNADAENKVKSVGLNMANVNRIYFKMILNDENVVIKLNNEVIDRAELIKNADGTFTLYSSDIKATGFNDVHTLTLTQGEEVISTVQYNVNAYVKSKNADENVGDIVKALSNYGVSAKRYVNSFKTIGDNQFELEEDIL